MSELKEIYQINQEITEDDNKLLNEFFLWIKVASKKKRKLIIAIDGIDSLDQIKISNKLIKRYPSNINMVFSSRSEFTRLLSSKQKRISNLLEISEFNQEEKKRFIEFQLSHHSKNLSESQLNKLVESKNTSHPLYIKTLIDELCLSATFETLDNRIDQLLESDDVEELYIRVIDRYEKRYSTSNKTDLIKNVFSNLYFSLTGKKKKE